MNKIKKVWTENKVLLVLAIILLVCLAVFGIVSLTYFYGSSNNVYGDRLDVIKNVPLSDKLFEDIKNTLDANESVSDSALRLRGKIIYIDIDFMDGTDIENAKQIAEGVVPLFNEDELEVYDLQFIIRTVNTENGFTLMGARNCNGSDSVVWNNRTITTDESSTEE